MFNRRRFFQMSAATFLAENLFSADGAPLPGGAQRFFGRRNAASGPYGAEILRLEAMTGMELTGWKSHPDDLPHPEDPNLNDSDWTAVPPFRRGQRRSAPQGEGGMWFRKWVEIPQKMGGYSIQGLPVRLDLRVFGGSRGPIRVFSNGSMVEMTPSNTQQPILLTNAAKPGEKHLIAAYSPAPGTVVARLEVEYPAGQSTPELLMNEILCVDSASKGFEDGKRDRDAQLAAAVKAINFNALDQGDQKSFDQSLAAADEKMQPLAEWIRQFTIRAVGNSHIDMAWLWPWPETVEVVRNTFGTVLELQDEFAHPGFFYAQSSAQDFYWLERYYPQEFKQIQQRVKNGQWELVGGMWVEPDLNMPCGESLARQILIGKRYFQQKFGVNVKIGWNPDSFGYSWQLAQIYKRSGIDYFVTQKMSWNDTIKMPYKLFHWESPDGSRVLTYFPHGYGNSISPVTCSQYVADDTPLCSGFKQQMLLFGMGDHGGGPTRQMLDVAMRWLKSPRAAFPTLKFSTAQEFFDEVASASLDLPVWKDELYLEFHRGTYTTQAESKRRMRESEVLVLNSEKFCSLAMLDGRRYPQEKFEDSWRRVCFNQFHDMMAGSGIHVNYEDEAESLEFVRDACLPELDASLRGLTHRIGTTGPGVPVVAFNPLSWSRSDVAEAEVQFPRSLGGGKVEVVDSQGNVMPSAEISRDDSTHTARVRFLARGVPALGYKVFRAAAAARPREAASELRVNGLTMENEHLRLTVDQATGCITSLISKKDGRNILRSGAKGNVLETFVDKPRQYDAWNIGWPYDQTKTELLQADEVKLVENTPVRAVIRVKKHFQKSSFVQEICMYPDVPRADVHMHADWREQHIMLKVAFPLDVSPEKASYEIPYGSIERVATYSTVGKPETPENKRAGAEWEVCAQRWGDLSQSGRGFSLLNACKYGYDTVEPGTLRLTLLRSPVSPDPIADQGPHDFTYSLYPHAGDWKEAGTQFQGYQLNYPLLVRATEAHAGALPPSHSFVEIDPANVILTAIKKAEDDDAVVFRFFEFEGKQSQVRLRLPAAATKAAQTSLMEQEEGSLSLGTDGRQISVPIGPYEIKSVKVSFANSAGAAPPRRV
ncbi:MAG: alpha-mannosidase [Terriglobia bacterium]